MCCDSMLNLYDRGRAGSIGSELGEIFLEVVVKLSEKEYFDISSLKRGEHYSK